MSIEERFPEEELAEMIENITEENKEKQRENQNFLSINELLKIIEKKADIIPTDKMKLLIEGVNIQIKNLTLVHELEKQTAVTKIKALEALLASNE